MTTLPSVLFLHGFLGCPEDWKGVVSLLAGRYNCHALDLSAFFLAESLEESLEGIVASLETLSLSCPHLVGYSMGGRLALLLKEKFPHKFGKLVILSARVGLLSEQEQASRLIQDAHWLELLRTTPLETFLEQWYAQPLFDSLRHDKALFFQLFERRKQQHIPSLIAMLEQFSPAKITVSCPKEGLFLYGEKDITYAALYSSLPSSVTKREIKGAGHAVHLENPSACATLIKSFSMEK